MSKKAWKRAGIITGAILGAIAVLVLIVPLFITIEPHIGMSLTSAVAETDGRLVTVPFSGTDGIDFFVTELGEKRADDLTLVLLHGSNYNTATWNLVSDGLAEYGRVIAYDQVPYGLSEKMTEEDWTDSNPYTVESALAQMRSLMVQLEAERVVLVGSSFGGTLAVQAALEYPEIVEGLILVDAAVFVSESMPQGLLNSRQMNNLGPLMARSLGTSAAFYERCYSDLQVFNEERKRLTMITSEITDWDAAYWEYLKAWGSMDNGFLTKIPEITVPTLVISGAEDQVVPVGDSVRLSEMIPRSELSIIEGVGHLPHEESPDEFLHIVGNWIRSTAD